MGNPDLQGTASTRDWSVEERRSWNRGSLSTYFLVYAFSLWDMLVMILSIQFY